ncbi:MAG: hydrolase, partial [Nitrospinota bacterium]|nr:hydrolase [Nitrospinota bacterium]
MPLEDELGDILQKARDGKMWSQDDLVKATDISGEDIQRIESYQLTPENSVIEKLAKTLDLDGPALIEIAQERWIPEPPNNDPDFDLVCLNVFMG